MVELKDFKEIKDYSGVYLLYLNDRSSLDIFKKEVAQKIWEYSSKLDGLIYIGQSDAIYRRIFSNHMEGCGGSTLRNSLNNVSFCFDVDYINSLNLSKTVNIFTYWLKNYTFFKVYKADKPGSIENGLIKKYQPIFNEGNYKKILEEFL